MPALFPDAPGVPTAPVTHSAQHNASTYLVTAHSDNSVTLWKRSATSWDVAESIPHQRSTVTDIAFSPDIIPNTFATCNIDGTATVYTFAIATKTTIFTTANLRDADTLSAIAFSDRGQLATLGDGALRIYGSKWGLLAQLDAKGNEVSFAPGGKAVIAGGMIFRCFDEDFEWSLFAAIENSEGVLSVDWGRDGLIAIGREESVEIWELQRGEPERIVRFEERGVQSVNWDTVGDHLTSIHSDGSKKNWARDGATWEWGLRDSVQPEVEAAA